MTAQPVAPGVEPSGVVHANLPPAELYELAVKRQEGQIVAHGPFITITAPHTGRSPNDKFIVREPTSASDIWWGEVNQPMEPEQFELLLHEVRQYLSEQNELFIRDVYAGADPAYRTSVRFVTTNAWHTLFAYNMFLRPGTEEEVASFVPDFTVLHAPDMKADPRRHGTRSGTFIVINFAERTILIGGTRYAGEMKKSMFTILNYLYPKQDILAMHCSATLGAGGDVAIFFGLSGTGKTTLSADPTRALIGDDEHGWSVNGVFNFEGGCYAKIIRLSAEGEPEIHATTQMFGTILENVVVDPATRRIDLHDDSITENTRASYPIHFIPNHVPEGHAGHPKYIVFLTADAFGVLPPVARLTQEQAMYHFLSGYTAKVAGTERGVTEPQATFSACFGAPFLPLHPSVYAKMLGERIVRHGAQCWLVNTGWTGGPYGEGRRVNLPYTRAMVRAALDGSLEGTATRPDPVFGLQVPEQLPNVPRTLLDPRTTWADPERYDTQAAKLARMFRENFQQFAGEVDDGVRRAGPRA
ncbi:MAG: phosphoenolpyruvate carboxykinase (ATP) [Gemmatimonadales bacterium]|nr:phosphoenolpyruvate carboxykinase (ATP) [Gemmatimonadales bacterium]NIN50688.1 phosphoenolpyruvate carboxykinase (ATP) [Gemmatimonadales bacterium]NIP08152.1 phosphoenolpyruvate carboxykinase (ATP) [Gemmatimonadales bacterium]NIR01030.1 phosphoenolpyruvate carboxykinase (ATP) [Gemmatimonadales bacterium]NIS65109.1 phosphoenolpyruvate carboxykinase (ATP) [Gemmatimonadales bacterium]